MRKMTKLRFRRLTTVLLALTLVLGFFPGLGPKKSEAAIDSPTAGAANDGVDFTATGLLAPSSYIYYGFMEMPKEPNGYSRQNSPILWNVMGEEPAKYDLTGAPLSTNNPDQLVLFSNYILNRMTFNPALNSAWEDSTVRIWLNETFLSNQFIAGERTHIVKTINLQTKDIVSNNPSYTSDYMYILATDDFGGDKVSWSSNYAPNKQLGNNSGTFIGGTPFSYHLRSPFNTEATAYVNELGELKAGNTDGLSGVRPAFKLDPASVVFASEIVTGAGDGMGTITADTNYIAGTGGSKHYKLTVLGGSGSSNPYKLTNLINPITNASMSSSTEISAKADGSFLLSGTTSATGGLNGSYTINYKLVDSNRKIVAYGVANNNASVSGRDMVITIPSNKIDGSPFASNEQLTAYVWLQKNNPVNSNETSQPLHFIVNLTSSDDDAPNLSHVSPSVTNTTAISVTTTEKGPIYLVPAATNPSVAAFENTIDSTGKKIIVSTPGASGTVPVAGLADGAYKLYAVDEAGNISTPESITIDNKSPTVTLSGFPASTVNAAFPITIVFNEAVTGFDGSGITVDNGEVSNLVPVTASTYTATISPIKSSQAVTVKVAANAAFDEAGNGNTVSDTFSVMYDATKPTVTFGGFADNQTFIAPPTSVTVTVNEAVYWVADGTPITSSNATSLLSMEKDGVSLSDYTLSYDEASRRFTLTFNGTLDDGVYKVIVAGNKVINAINNTLDEASSIFTVAVPVVSGISVHPTSLSSAAGNVTATITGANLTGQSIKVFVDGAEAATANVSSATSATATVAIPKNTTTSVRNHILKVYLNGVEVAGKTATVTVSGEPVVSSGDGSPPMPATPSTPTPAKPVIDLNGIKLDPDTIDTAKPSVTLEVTPRNGSAYVTIPASILTRLEGKNAAFFIEIKAPYGSYRVPVDLASLIPGLKDLLATNNLKAEDIGFKINLIDKSGDKAIYAAFANGLPNGSVMGAIVDFGIEIINTKTGKVLGNADKFSMVITRIIPMLKNMTEMPTQWGAFRFNETTKKFEFVPAKKVKIDGVWYVTISSYSNSVYVVADNEVSFADVQKHWGKSFIELAAAKGLVEGADGKYNPNKTVTRAEFTAMLVRALGRGNTTGSTTPYDDVKPDAWYFEEVAEAKELGLLDFVKGNSFLPEQPLTREEMASMLAAAIAFEKLPMTMEFVSLDGYKDIGSVDAAYLEDVRLMVKLKIMTGVDEDTFTPKGTTTRAEAATVFIRTLQKLGMID